MKPAFEEEIKGVLGRSAGADEQGEAALELEFVALTRYLLGAVPPPVLRQRYVAAHRVLLKSADQNEPELRFLRSHPGAWPFLDAALGFTRRHSIVRKKVLLATAILEATPTYADFFLQPPAPPMSLCLGLFWQAICSAGRLTVGIPLWLVARRRR